MQRGLNFNDKPESEISLDKIASKIGFRREVSGTKLNLVKC